MIPPDKSQLFNKFDRYLAAAVIVSIVICYAGLNLIYNIEEVDDAWTLSFIYNLFVRHIPPESSFGGGLANIKYFGMTQGYIYTFVLNIIGWTKFNAHIISIFFIVLSALAWYGILKKLKFSSKLSFFFSLLVLWCEPFFREAVVARPESLTFFLVSLGFLLFISEKYFFAGLIAMVAVENHPMGVIFFVYALSYIVYAWPDLCNDKKSLIKKSAFFISGCIPGVLYYFILHHQYLSGTAGTIREGSGGLFNTVLFQYFFIVAKYERHIADFVFFCICLIIFIIKGYYKKMPFVAIFLFFLIAANFINPRTNFHYTLYFYPAFILLSLYTFEKTGRLNWAVSFLFLIFLAYDASVVYRKHYYNFDEYISKIGNAVPVDNIPVVGGPNEWYAFKDREYYAGVYTFSFNTNAGKFYLIEGNLFRNGYPGITNIDLCRKYIASNYSGKLIRSLEINNEKYDILLMTKIK